ncbi:MAG: hypothetical protein U0973_00760 [Xanthomonadaceae bacterium]|nr:hypothetical protein [Xanthomonadaceae bacterium]
MFELLDNRMPSRALIVAALWAAMAGSGTAQALADPLRPAPSAVALGAAQGAAGAPVLSMIVLSDARSHVVLDGTVRRIGDRFGGYRLSQIGPTKVVLVSDDGQRLAVSLLPLASVKQSSDRKP